MRTTRTTSSSTAARSFPPPTHPGDGLAPPRSHYNHRAALVALLSIYLLGNAYIGSAECTKEFQFGDMKGITFIPIFLERLAQSEAEFEAGKPRWRPDRSRSFYEQWSGYRDVLDRLAGPK